MSETPKHSEAPPLSREVVESSREADAKNAEPSETPASLEVKIKATEGRIADNSASIEQTGAQIEIVRAELGSASSTKEPPSITQSRKTISRLEKQRQALTVQKEGLEEGGIGEVGEKPTRMENDPRFAELSASMPLRMVPNAMAVHESIVKSRFRQLYPADSAAYDAAASLKEDEQIKLKKLDLQQENEAREKRRRVDNAARSAGVTKEKDLKRNTVVLDPERAEKARQERAASNAARQRTHDDTIKAGEEFARWERGEEPTVETKTPEEGKPTVGVEIPRVAEGEPTAAIDRSNVKRNLENLWANSGSGSSPELEALRQQIQTGSEDEVQKLNDGLIKAGRVFARTHQPDTLAGILTDLSVGNGSSEAQQSAAEEKGTRKMYSELGVQTPNATLDAGVPKNETGPRDVKDILAKEQAEKEKTTNRILQFAQSPELFIDQMPDSGPNIDYSAKMGIKVMVDAFKAMYPDPVQRAERLQSIYSAYNATREAFGGQQPEKGQEYAANYASNQTVAGLPEHERQILNDFIEKKLNIIDSGGAKTSFSPQIIMVDFTRFLDSING